MLLESVNLRDSFLLKHTDTHTHTHGKPFILKSSREQIEIKDKRRSLLSNV